MVLAQEDTSPLRDDPDRVLWFMDDQQNTTRDLIDNTGALVQHYTYDTFGVPTSGNQYTTRYMYTGREWDPFLQLQYNRARWYSPDLGRWMSEDPIGFNGDPSNLYRYVGNSPTNFTDPLGLEPVGLPPGDGGTPGNIIAMGFLLFQSPLSRALFTHYVQGSGTTYTLTAQEATALRAERLSVDSSPVFFAAKERAREVAEQTCRPASRNVQFDISNSTDLPRALGVITNRFRGTATVKPDGKWSFQGTVEFRDRYDFDPLWFNTHRTVAGEILTIWASIFTSGKAFDVRGTFIASQDSNEAYVQWPGEWDDEI